MFVHIHLTKRLPNDQIYSDNLHNFDILKTIELV